MTPKIIAHRGVTRNDQENTIPAFHKAFSEGADGLEIDVRLSKDKKPIIFHDEDTSRPVSYTHLTLPTTEAV